MGIKGQEPSKDGALTGNCSNNSLVLNHKIGLSTLSTNKRWGYPISLQKWRNYYKRRFAKKSRASSHLSYIHPSFPGSRATIHNCTTIIRHQTSTPFLTVIDSPNSHLFWVVIGPFFGVGKPPRQVWLRCFSVLSSPRFSWRELGSLGLLGES